MVIRGCDFSKRCRRFSLDVGAAGVTRGFLYRGGGRGNDPTRLDQRFERINRLDFARRLKPVKRNSHDFGIS